MPSVDIRVVELDGAVVDVAERWFGFSRAGVDVTVGAKHLPRGGGAQREVSVTRGETRETEICAGRGALAALTSVWSSPHATPRSSRPRTRRARRRAPRRRLRGRFRRGLRAAVSKHRARQVAEAVALRSTSAPGSLLPRSHFCARRDAEAFVIVFREPVGSVKDG